jgi:hypothetical protein
MRAAFGTELALSPDYESSFIPLSLPFRYKSALLMEMRS